MSKTAKLTLLGILFLILMAAPWMLNSYGLQILILTISYSMLGLAFAFTLKVGLPRFDIAGLWAVGAYTSALLMQKEHLSFWLTIPAGIIIAVALGWLIFSVAIPRGMMVFLLFGMVIVLAVEQIVGSVSFFGGWGGTGMLPHPTIAGYTIIKKPDLYYMGLFFLIVNILIYYLLYNSKIGRAWNAIGSSVKLANSVGINVVRYRMANVLIGNVFLAVAGSYFVAYSSVVAPSTFSFPNSVNIMMYVVIGGISYSLFGPLVGAAIITFIPEYFRIAKEKEPIFTAIAIILIIILMPAGVIGIFDRRAIPWFKRVRWLSWFTNKAKES